MESHVRVRRVEEEPPPGPHAVDRAERGRSHVRRMRLG
jgi:hypothetical protein